MHYTYTNAVCFGDLKQAALYFDRVFALSGIWHFIEEIQSLPKTPDKVS